MCLLFFFFFFFFSEWNARILKNKTNKNKTRFCVLMSGRKPAQNNALNRQKKDRKAKKENNDDHDDDDDETVIRL